MISVTCPHCGSKARVSHNVPKSNKHRVLYAGCKSLSAKATITEVISAHLQQTRKLIYQAQSLLLFMALKKYNTMPGKAKPATIAEQVNVNVLNNS